MTTKKQVQDTKAKVGRPSRHILDAIPSGPCIGMQRGERVWVPGRIGQLSRDRPTQEGTICEIRVVKDFATSAAGHVEVCIVAVDTRERPIGKPLDPVLVPAGDLFVTEQEANERMLAHAGMTVEAIWYTITRLGLRKLYTEVCGREIFIMSNYERIRIGDEAARSV